MTPDERERMEKLCNQIAIEKDPKIFDQLIQELNDLLAAKQERIQSGRQNRRV